MVSLKSFQFSSSFGFYPIELWSVQQSLIPKRNPFPDVFYSMEITLVSIHSREYLSKCIIRNRIAMKTATNIRSLPYSGCSLQ